MHRKVGVVVDRHTEVTARPAFFLVAPPLAAAQVEIGVWGPG